MEQLPCSNPKGIDQAIVSIAREDVRCVFDAFMVTVRVRVRVRVRIRIQILPALIVRPYLPCQRRGFPYRVRRRIAQLAQGGEVEASRQNMEGADGMLPVERVVS